MGWSNDIPSPFAVGGDGVSGRIEVYDASNNLLATIDENGMIVYDALGNIVDRNDANGIEVLGTDGSSLFLSVGGGAAMEATPPELPGHPIKPAVVYGGSFEDAFERIVQLGLEGPGVDGLGFAQVIIFGEDGISGAPAFIQATGRFEANGKTIVGTEDVLNSAQGAATTTSATFVNMPAPSSLSFTKQWDDTYTDLVVDLDVGVRVTVAGATGAEFAILCDGVDTVITKKEIFTIGEHETASGIVKLTGLAAGTYTIQVRWRRNYGGGTLNSDNNDQISLSVREVAIT